MPLPPALAARLAKRGLIKEEPAPQPKKQSEEVEEVFAEDYDDPSKVEVGPEVETQMQVEKEKEASDKDDDEDDTDYVHDVINCPNRTNPFHRCVKYCRNRYGLKTFSADADMVRKKERMLRKYPLPDGWKEVADPDTGRYYYWSLQTDQVSWLSPAHPQAVISMPTDRLTDILALDNDLENQEEEMETMEDERMEEDSGSSSSSDSDSEDDSRRISRRDAERQRQDAIEEQRGRGFREQQRRGPDKRRGHARRDEIDPMDPAAYSDVPRGGWTDGLDTRGSAKTGVDVTATGPLFQQRPYPSPGDILRANQQLKKKA